MLFLLNQKKANCLFNKNTRYVIIFLGHSFVKKGIQNFEMNSDFFFFLKYYVYTFISLKHKF